MTPTNLIFGFPAATVNTFDAVYLASQPLAIQNLMAMSDADAADGSNPREMAASALATKGYAIDVQIMAWGWGAYETMYQRLQDGFGTVMDGLGQIKLKVSVDPADFPPFPIPVASVDPAAQYIEGPINGVGIGAGWFPMQLTAADKLPDGTGMTFQGHTFTLHVTVSQTGLQAGLTQLIYVWIQTSD